MSGNAYIRVGLLATHPAFDVEVGALRCPVCRFTFARVKDYEACLFGHDPSRKILHEWLSGKSWERVAFQRGWLKPCPGTGAPVDGKLTPCPTCGTLAAGTSRGKIKPHQRRRVSR